jgi:thiol-disulfide isomerase/thioredoxin
MPSSCQTQNIVTYEEGLENCNQMLELEMKDNPNGLFFVGAHCLVGSQIPEFETTSLEGRKINRELLKGKLSILNFWFISCPPCVAEIPGLNSIVEKFGTHQINYIAIGRDSQLDIADFLNQHPWQFEQISDGNQIIQDNFKLRWGFPTTFLLNKNAEIVLAFSGGKTDSTAVEEIQNILIPVIERELK